MGRRILTKETGREVRIMKIVKMVLVLLSLSTGLLAGSSQVYGSGFKGSASIDVMSNYVWRGFKLSNSYVIQPSVGITYGRLNTSLWSNYDGDWGNRGELTETDLTLSYTLSSGDITLDVGYVYYGLESADDTQELYISAGYDLAVSPAITVYYDIEEGKGAFIVASMGYSIGLSDSAGIELGASVGYNADSEYSVGNYTGFHNGEISASIGIAIAEGMSIGSVLTYSFPLSDEAEAVIEAISDDAQSSILYGGVNMSLGF